MLLNSTPSGLILRKSFKLHTWNPPLSVSTGPFQLMNLWMPPAAAIFGVVGRKYKWYVLARIICALMSSLSCAGVTALTVASVPTGIKIGVWMSPWSVCKTPRRALDFFDVFFSSKRFMVANVEFYGREEKGAFANKKDSIFIESFSAVGQT